MRALFLLISLFCSQGAYASDTGLSGFNIQHFHLAGDGSGVFSIEGSQLLKHHHNFLRLHSDVSGSLITSGNPATNRLVDLIDTLWSSEISFSLGLFDIANVGLQVPFYFYVGGNNESQRNFQTTSLGDVGFDGKIRLLEESSKTPGVAFKARLTAPTGENSKFTGEGSPTFSLKVILDRHWDDLYVATNLGYQFIDRHFIQSGRTGAFWNVKNDDRLLFGMGTSYKLPWQNKSWSVLGQLIGETVISHGSEVTTPIEFHLGCSKKFDHGLNLEAGAGRGLTNAIGSPAYRVFLGLSYDFSTLQ
ncbi:MAG: hypothetical protein A2W61_06540 [Deltaproteobacteria bacterium RIFCSPLOWO2_01_44_7]|nr:MAG: hypothetical protein A2712_09920 [Deltaproteobacteria bacterium RIFCSPHIGHO2_01_FULL_43_49]OGQ15428.1 MAG: hypothetical protein A3D22_10450 [Deltaproteobacteria bacterium RIFCSPHIGHO2_02_FULL_44_53]OGQ29621.1 MAG: hypothetical protein A3D98_10650 [Deltaproteobacteria bacterium RIFCSPHIGHO2_12_FULL_44_21]OGQ32234.1 MAG: hypothetical protein A2979_00295 [Deltaproteobacteria bacterium RIFCSPLOWO2_01_FULL_45_74]OGQ37863.1 MAG: hypothetical protein A2W61_06540 [Deltaproteobacteria bacterium 